MSFLRHLGKKKRRFTFRVYVHDVSPVPRELEESSVPVCCLFRRGNKRYRSGVALADDGVVHWGSTVSFQCTLYYSGGEDGDSSSDSDGEVKQQQQQAMFDPKEFTISLVDNNSKRLAVPHVASVNMARFATLDGRKQQSLFVALAHGKEKLQLQLTVLCQDTAKMGMFSPLGSSFNLVPSPRNGHDDAHDQQHQQHNQHQQQQQRPDDSNGDSSRFSGSEQIQSTRSPRNNAMSSSATSPVLASLPSGILAKRKSMTFTTAVADSAGLTVQTDGADAPPPTAASASTATVDGTHRLVPSESTATATALFPDMPRTPSRSPSRSPQPLEVTEDAAAARHRQADLVIASLEREVSTSEASISTATPSRPSQPVTTSQQTNKSSYHSEFSQSASSTAARTNDDDDDHDNSNKNNNNGSSSTVKGRLQRASSLDSTASHDSMMHQQPQQQHHHHQQHPQAFARKPRRRSSSIVFATMMQQEQEQMESLSRGNSDSSIAMSDDRQLQQRPRNQKERRHDSVEAIFQ
eukprot:TRINITY_DN65950_c6_g7_i1.p1 TRINITY_DN65950_c6_g7~~TRINITY_DN65950_c6_g7_i1.p1  ORF type:complete len:522 (-),score=238.57 TRINITY_DN65950_c6_g7_i1:44-1609(-)